MNMHLNLYFDPRWQARREHDRSMRAGLIPSRALQERRIVEERKILMAAKAREFEGRHVWGLPFTLSSALFLSSCTN